MPLAGLAENAAVGGGSSAFTGSASSAPDEPAAFVTVSETA